MHTTTRYAATLVLAAALLLSGCAYGNHIKQGDAYFEQGRYEMALREYESAQKLEPDEIEAADKINQARNRLADHYIAQADAALGDGELFVAIEAASKAYEFLPRWGRVSQLVDRVSARAQADAEAEQALQNWAYALALYEAVTQQLPPKRSEFGPRAAQTRRDWSDALQIEARDAQEQSRWGLAALYWAKSLQLTGDSTARARLGQMRQKVRDRHLYRAHLVGDTSSAGFQVVAASLAHRRPERALSIQTQRPAGDATINAVMHVSVSEPTFDSDLGTRAESVRYQSGTRLVKNDAYARAQDELTDEERELVADQRALSDAQYELEYYRSEVAREAPSDTPSANERTMSRAHNKVEQVRNQVDDQRDRVQRAREALASTEQFIEEPVYRDLTYTISTHRRTAASQVAIRIEHADTRPALQASYTISLESSDDTHRAYPEAGIAADPLEMRSERELRATLFDDAVAPVSDVIEESFLGWRQKLVTNAQQATSEPTRMDLYALYILSDPETVEPGIAESLASMSGIPDAYEVLRP